MPRVGVPAKYVSKLVKNSLSKIRVLRAHTTEAVPLAFSALQIGV